MKHPFLTTLAFGSAIILLSGASAAWAADMSDQEFVAKASAANKFEIQTSQQALAKTQNTEVKTLAQMLVLDHKKAGETLSDILDSKDDLQASDQLDPKQSRQYEQLQKASGKEFDAQYLAAQKKAHREAIDLFSKYAASGKDADLKQFASDTLPTLQKHLEQVQSISR